MERKNLHSNPTKINRLFTHIDSNDKKLSHIIHNLELPHLLEQIIYLFGRLFNPDFIFCYLLIILLYKIYNENDYLFVLKPFTHTLISLFITILIKKLTARPRPNLNTKVVRLYNLRQHEKNFSMPSGDSLQCANFSIILFLYFNSHLGFYLIPFVMFSRIYFFCHYILDTVIGAIMGFFISMNIFLLLN